MKKKFLIVLLITLMFPINILAYSNRLIVGGENIGIEVNSKGLLVIGFYKVNNKLIAKESGLKTGDIITKVNNKIVETSNDLISELETNDNIVLTINRNNKYLNITTNKEKEDGIIKTGIYIKDKITGIGTLTFIDPEEKKFAALGHEINSKETGKIFNINNGIIFKSNVISIEKSTNGEAGSKECTYDKEKIYGNINKNTKEGIYGTYNENITNDNLYDIGNVKEGEAIIRTVIKDNIKEDFKINILEINKLDNTKNILFEIIDENLLNKTGGILQGMSGSPILQSNKIVGAVTHVIVNNPKRGYGIFIKNMLEELDKND